MARGHLRACDAGFPVVVALSQSIALSLASKLHPLHAQPLYPHYSTTPRYPQVDAQEMNRYRVLVDMLENDLDAFQLCDPQNYRAHYNPLVPWAKLFGGVIAVILTLLWLIQIIVYMLFTPPLHPFLNTYFSWCVRAWGACKRSPPGTVTDCGVAPTVRRSIDRAPCVRRDCFCSAYNNGACDAETRLADLPVLTSMSCPALQVRHVVPPLWHDLRGHLWAVPPPRVGQGRLQVRHALLSHQGELST